MPHDVIKRSSSKAATWALPLAEKHNLYADLDRWLNETARDLKAKMNRPVSASGNRVLFINNDFIDAQDRRVTQLMDIMKGRGYEITLIAIGREKWQEDLTLNTNSGIGKATCVPIYMKEYEFSPWMDPAITLFFYGAFPQKIKKWIMEKLQDWEQDQRSGPREKPVTFKAQIARKLWRIEFVRKIFYRYFALTLKKSELQISNIEHNPLPLMWAQIRAALSLGKKFDAIAIADLPSLPAGIMLKRVFEASLVYDAHELFPEQIVFNKEVKFFLSFWESFCLRHTNLALTTSPWTADFMEKSYELPQNSVKYFSNAPAFDKPAILAKSAARPLRSAISVDTSHKILLFHGGINRFRNIELLIEAFSKITSPNASLVFLGSGDYDSYKNMAAKLKAKNVHFLPAVPQSELAPWVQDADAVLIPYPAIDHNTRICTPNKLYDCLHLSVPILANSDLDVLGDIFAEYKIGFQFHTDSPEHLAADLDSILSEGKLDEIRKHGDFARAYRDFGWETQTKLIEEALDSGGFFGKPAEDLKTVA